MRSNFTKGLCGVARAFVVHSRHILVGSGGPRIVHHNPLTAGGIVTPRIVEESLSINHGLMQIITIATLT